MAGGTQKLIDKVNSNASSATTITEVSQLAGVATILRGCNYDVVTSAACLPAAASNTGRMVAIDSGSGDVCYRFSDGFNWKCDYDSTSGILQRQLWLVGINSWGQLGNGVTGGQYDSPVTTAGGGTTWCQVSVGGYTYHTQAIKTDGTLWGWGQNTGSYPMLGTGDGVGYNSPVTTAGGGTNWCQVSAGYYNSSAIKTDGTLWGWGRNNTAQLGDNSTIARASPITTAGGGTNWCQVSAGDAHTSAIKTDGTLWAWGYNGAGQLGNGNTTAVSSPVTTAGGGTTWCQVSAGENHSMAIKTDGTLWTMGLNSLGQLGTGNTTAYSSPVTTAGGGTTWCAAVTGLRCFSMGIKTDGTLWGWGNGGSSQFNFMFPFGQGSASSPAASLFGTGWCQVAAGKCQSAAIKQVFKGF